MADDFDALLTRFKIYHYKEQLKNVGVAGVSRLKDIAQQNTLEEAGLSDKVLFKAGFGKLQKRQLDRMIESLKDDKNASSAKPEEQAAPASCDANEELGADASLPSPRKASEELLVDLGQPSSVPPSMPFTIPLNQPPGMMPLWPPFGMVPGQPSVVPFPPLAYPNEISNFAFMYDQGMPGNFVTSQELFNTEQGWIQQPNMKRHSRSKPSGNSVCSVRFVVPHCIAQQVWIVGSVPELGNWVENRGKQCLTDSGNPSSFWSSEDIKLPLGKDVKYKIHIQTRSGDWKQSRVHSFRADRQQKQVCAHWEEPALDNVADDDADKAASEGKWLVYKVRDAQKGIDRFVTKCNEQRKFVYNPRWYPKQTPVFLFNTTRDEFEAAAQKAQEEGKDIRRNHFVISMEKHRQYLKVEHHLDPWYELLRSESETMEGNTKL